MVALTPSLAAPTASVIDQAVAAWLSTKYRLSRSADTKRCYESIIAHFRVFLADYGLDLDPWGHLSFVATDAERKRALADFSDKLQQFAELPQGRGKARKTELSESTYNTRLTALSSFYRFCAKTQRLSCGNPVALVERAKIHRYKEVRALDIEDVRRRLASIDRASKIGARDYALFSVFLETGRRCDEVLSMQWKHCTVLATKEIEVVFPACKGGKTMKDLLTKETSAALLAWLRVEYGEDIGNESPIWVSQGRSAQKQGLHKPLDEGSLWVAAGRRLGSNSVHRLRHTMATGMHSLGIPLEDIQAQLGHDHLSTTEIYVKALQRPQNPHRERIAKLFGLKQA